ncbi:DUF2380 domain-containing protein [Nitrospirillum iridis]|uniref:DUF2380 domain-containing protein n=1 Tax=Nitrospirillum iridis TaxID=765888 RepID=A0A7X0B219_9PROT|nr:DUF2380 domain-containing protein [Nitrospirillum iridis]MBB6254288.1 hypothetical protein [Nitrospirillum iridis]
MAGVLRAMWFTTLLAGLLVAPPPSGARAAGAPAPIAVADFDFVDTSGEAKDQNAEHEGRLRGLDDSIRAGLDKGGRYRVVSLDCGRSACRGADPATLVDAARRAGARLLLLGGVHKTSTLLLSAKVQVLDIGSNTLVLDRFLSFRGDNDEAWRRMALFVARELEELPL